MTVKPDTPRLLAMWFTGIVALMGMATLCWTAIAKIYIDVPMLLVISNTTVGAVSVFSTLLVGRTVAQLNQNSDVKNQPQTQEVANQNP